MNRLNVLLKDYLEQNTNYALLLTGGWGEGKTYYLKNHFFNSIEDTGYHPVLVSLFGVRTIDGIKDRIIAELYPILGNKYLKTTKTILKTVVKSADITKLFGEGIFASLIDEVSQGKKELKAQHREYLQMDKLLVCFDDLERASPEMLTNSEILGYINSMVEGNNIKVIIVANEGIFEDKKYLEVKEKTIGNTIHFHQNFDDAFLNILKSSEQPNSYKEFLEKNQHVILEFLSVDQSYTRGKVNYRTLTQFITKFSQIFQFIDNGLGIADLEELNGEILNNLLKFSLFVFNEYKKGIFTFLDRKGFGDETSIAIKRYMHYSSENPNFESINTIKIADAYFPSKDFKFYDSIYSYLTGGDFFDKDKFLTELKYEYHVVDENITEAYKIRHTLSQVNYKTLHDQQYFTLTKKLRTYALSGAFELHDYQQILFLVLRHGNPLRINEQKFCRQLLVQIRKRVSIHVYNPLIVQHVTVSDKSEFYESNILLRDEIIDVNEKAFKLNRSKEIEKIEQELVKDYQSFHDRMIKLINTPFGVANFAGVSFRKFCSVFLNADNAKKSQMVLLFRILYDPRKGNTSIRDLIFLKGLHQVLERRICARGAKNMSGALTLDLLKAVNESVAEVQSYHSDNKC